MKKITYKFAKEFSDCPGGRERVRSDYSGQEFREDVLEKLWTDYDEITLDLNDVFAFAPSFVDEALGKMMEKYTVAEFNRKISIILNDDDLTSSLIDDLRRTYGK